MVRVYTEFPTHLLYTSKILFCEQGFYLCHDISYPTLCCAIMQHSMSVFLSSFWCFFNTIQSQNLQKCAQVMRKEEFSDFLNSDVQPNCSYLLGFLCSTVAIIALQQSQHNVISR